MENVEGVEDIESVEREVDILKEEDGNEDEDEGVRGRRKGDSVVLLIE